MHTDSTAGHPYEALAERIRDRIRSGQYAPGSQLPPLRALADAEGVAYETARRAIGWLAESGAVRVTTHGTYVEDSPPVGSGWQHRLRLWQATGSTTGAAEIIKGADIRHVRPPRHVAEIFELPPGTRQILRRRYIVGDDDRPRAAVTEWWSPDLAERVPALAEPRPNVQPPGTVLTAVRDATGRQPTTGRDAMVAREATGWEADALRVRDGAPVLALVWQWSDGSGLMVYGESVLPAGIEVGYAY
ncbi:GntR family transcriptional regulator [Streptomyces aidingensis]|uniref:DNA-binding transcriptional regulator, GntR family n=1 Tax=Streptomyces aidingensis TaxID=910347 RepID=A0A1I1MYD8_9ACTN|nr:GntR family transcriptional regulator [Streptomyces aidingensis]SFC90421.1 DNA-binding transcriptional regulator, GntR family [Streptomyces aidingensis]